jgi:hypothetical protein
MGAWQQRLRELLDQVAQWAQESDWATREVKFKLKEVDAGSYTAPGLLMQKDSIKIMVEPIGSGAPGADGVVDLYLMPEYDDVASMYFENGVWNLYYFSEQDGTFKAKVGLRELPPRVVNKANLFGVLEEMVAHVG